MNEAEFATAVEDALERFGWQWCHYRPARTVAGWRTALSGHKGLHDYIATRDGRLLIFELKSDEGRVSPEQATWHCRLKLTEAEIYIWRPADWPEIEKALIPEPMRL